jgi:hypothetical protein
MGKSAESTKDFYVVSLQQLDPQMAQNAGKSIGTSRLCVVTLHPPKTRFRDSKKQISALLNATGFKKIRTASRNLAPASRNLALFSCFRVFLSLATDSYCKFITTLSGH